MSEYSHFMSLVLNLKNKNDVVDLLRREGIYDGVSQKEVVFLGFFNLIHVYYMHCNLHAQFQPTGIRMCVVFLKYYTRIPPQKNRSSVYSGKNTLYLLI